MLRAGHAVALCALALLTVGVVMVSSAGMSLHARETTTLEVIVLSRNSLNMGLALAAMGLCALLPIRRLVPISLRTAGGCGSDDGAMNGQSFLSRPWIKAWARHMAHLWPLWLWTILLMCVLLTVYIPGIARARNGARRWITLHLPGLDSLQPSEIAKWGMAALTAWYAARYAATLRSFWFGLVPGLMATGLVAAVIVKEDLGTGVLVAAAAAVVLIGAGCRVWHLAALAPLPIAGVIAAIRFSPYRMARIESFLNPYADPQGKGYHQIQSMAAVAHGQFVGQGLGHGGDKFGFLPEDTTDFIFAIIAEELGVFGAALVLALLAMLIWSIYLIVRRERWPVLRLFGLGVMATLGIQALINLAVVTGLGPTKGIALPLVSSGGTGWILTAATLGLIIAAERSQPDAERYEKAPSPTPANLPDTQPRLIPA